MRRLSFTSIAFLFALTLSAQTLPPGVQRVTSVEGITEYAYPNGLHLLLFPDRSNPKVTVNITYLVGSRHEGNGETGMAHLMEHILFLQTKDGRSVKKEITAHGAQWNGSTWYDRTNYFEIFSATDENLSWAIGLEADRMVNMRVEKALLDTEMTVVRNEFESGENSPTNILYQRTLGAAYSYHSYGRPTIGTKSDIENVPIERLDAFYHMYYQPDNAVLTIAGQFDSSKVLALVAQAFGSIPKPARKLPQTYTVEPVQEGERAVTLRRIGDIQAVIGVYHTPASTHPDSAPLEVLAEILGDSPSGRLYKALVDNKKAVAAGAGMQELHDPGFLITNVILRQDQSIADARDIMLKTVEGVAKEPPSKEEVERAKTKILKQFDLDLTNSQNIGLAISEYAAAGDWRLLFLTRDRVKTVTEQDVARVAGLYLKETNRTLGEFIPSKSPDLAAIPATPAAGDVLKNYTGGAAISEGEAFSPTPAIVEGRVLRPKLANGMGLALLPKKTRGGVVVARVRLDFGDEKSAFGKADIGSFTGALLVRGTKTKSRQQIQDEMDRLKARINISGSATAAIASIETTEENLAGSLKLVAELLREPSFPESEFEQIKQLRIASIENVRTLPQPLASLELQRHFNSYPRGDIRYASTLDEQLEDLKKVTLDDVHKFYAQFYGASDGKLVVNGQFAPADVQKLAAELFGTWKSPSAYALVKENYRKFGPMDKNIETPDKPNAVFMAAVLTKMTDEDPDFPAMVMANYLFGGGGGSRLFKRVREKEGLSYGVNSGFFAPTADDRAMFSVTAISNAQNAPKVEASIKDELAKTLKEGFTDEEVTAAKKAWLELQLVGRSQDANLLTMLMTRERFKRTLHWDEAFEAKVAALTPQQISDAFRRHIDAASLTVVKAGDFKKAGVFQ